MAERKVDREVGIREDALADEQNRSSIQSLGVINFLVGIWLIVSPWIFNYQGGAMWNQFALGIVVAVLAAARFVWPAAQSLSVLNFLAGIWLIIAPWVISYNVSAAYWNEVIFGIIVAILAFANSTTYVSHHRTHHHAV